MKIGRMRTDDTLILTNNNFATTGEETIKLAKIITKDREYLAPTHLLKFNGAQIKLDSKDIILIIKSYVERILLVRNYAADSTRFRVVTKKKLSPKKQYLGKRVKGAYIVSLCPAEVFFDFFWVAQTVEFSPNDIAKLNKRLQ